MEIIFLGTSSGVPTKTRNVSAIVVKKPDEKSWYLVDCGESTQHQVLRTDLSLVHLTAILITHVHGDHCYGLPGLLASASMAGRKHPLTIIAPKPIKTLIETSQSVTDTFLTYEIQFTEVESLDHDMNLPDFRVRAWPLSHRVPCYAYTFVERHVEQSLDAAKLLQAGIEPGPVWGQLQQREYAETADGKQLISADFKLPGRKPRKIIVGGDNDTPELLADAMKQADLLIHESTFTEVVAEKVGPGPQHSTAKQVAEFSTKASLSNLILTHFSARYQMDGPSGSSIADIEQEARAYYSGNLYLANDFDQFHLNKSGELKRLKTKS